MAKNCITPEYPYCPTCKYGLVIWPEWVETYEDTFDATCEWRCLYNGEEEE